MLIVFSRVLEEATTGLLIEPEGDWDLLKIAMCNRLVDEGLFNRADAWSTLREGHVVSDGTMLVQVKDITAEASVSGGGILSLTAFDGTLVEIIGDEL
ncbi:hypothetical protein [Streptomyces sp. CBMA29]|uniref:hypothetical protein n=1 Tax=Streptomyces sp. CBMA29 TaxID=1896314 RepID=UPI00166201D7|nr:hypothetical protein [Streptomyces sp. CBMA29]MBD0734116.1 hypothetical protein [Streptomyces sp. CBMA29]